MDKLWIRFRPEIRKRIDILEDAAAACSAGRLSTEQRAAAHAAAHKLAGTLGTFNLTNGTVLAREFELSIASRDIPVPATAARLAFIAAELRTIVDSRK
jgi:HPt (histidine-containing phosphotransfer) domain-containing protein